ncbi:MAG: CxxC-x17-CxxC domain-containing protein [Nitrososphaeria archaeon]
MHKITCSDCGKEDEVPFKPTEGKPVYCRECYRKHKQY